jgi:hypothetical protein
MRLNLLALVNVIGTAVANKYFNFARNLVTVGAVACSETY